MLDRRAGIYDSLAGAASFGQYLENKPSQEDEEILTEPVLQDLIQELLGFPADAYFPQFSKGGLKPDLTPMDTIAHSFVLDAKSSLQHLAGHETQIRTYIDQRRLDFGILFNLRELRVFRRGEKGHDPRLSFHLLPLWEAASDTAFAIDDELAALQRFVDLFRFHEMGLEEKIERIRSAESWADLDARGEVVEVDIDYLVEQLRELSRRLAEDVAAQQGSALREYLQLNPGRERSMLGELEGLAQDIEPGTDLAALPANVAGYVATKDGLVPRVWSQYRVRVAQLALGLLDLWYGVRGKRPRDVWRNYEPKPMAEIPYRHVEGIENADSPLLDELDAALAERAAAAAAKAASRIGERLADGAKDADAIAAAALERLVRAIAANRRALLPRRRRFPGLERVVKDPWSIGPVDTDRPACTRALPTEKLVSVRIDAELSTTVEREGVLGRMELEPGVLRFRHGKRGTATVEGPPGRLVLLQELIAGLDRPLTDDLEGVLLPKDLGAFDAMVEAEASQVAELLSTGRTLVEAAERLVCRLYELRPELEDEVVAHAFERAESGR